jgi:hypothetical protein
MPRERDQRQDASRTNPEAGEEKARTDTAMTGRTGPGRPDMPVAGRTRVGGGHPAWRHDPEGPAEAASRGWEEDDPGTRPHEETRVPGDGSNKS